MKKTTQVIARC